MHVYVPRAPYSFTVSVFFRRLFPRSDLEVGSYVFDFYLAGGIGAFLRPRLLQWLKSASNAYSVPCALKRGLLREF